MIKNLWTHSSFVSAIWASFTPPMYTRMKTRAPYLPKYRFPQNIFSSLKFFPRCIPRQERLCIVHVPFTMITRVPLRQRRCGIVVFKHVLMQRIEIATHVHLIEVSDFCVHWLEVQRMNRRDVHVALNDLTDVVEAMIYKSQISLDGRLHRWSDIPMCILCPRSWASNGLLW